jgi:ferric-dicitrate binding protein FerR (iron transport regulator)
VGVIGTSVRYFVAKQSFLNVCGLEAMPRFDSVTGELVQPKGTQFIQLALGDGYTKNDPAKRRRYLIQVGNRVVSTDSTEFILWRLRDATTLEMGEGSACVFDLHELEDPQSALVVVPGKPAHLKEPTPPPERRGPGFST